MSHPRRMTFLTAVRTCFDKFITFKGRASRSEFWKFILFIALGLVVCTVINSFVFGPETSVTAHFNASGDLMGYSNKASYNSGLIGNIFGLIVLLPLLAVGWRRMHDIGRAGYLPWVLHLGATAISGILLFFTAEAVTLEGTMINFPNPPGAVVAAVIILTFGALITNIVWLARRPQPEPNTYGPPPQI